MGRNLSYNAGFAARVTTLCTYVCVTVMLIVYIGGCVAQLMYRNKFTVSFLKFYDKL